MSKNTLVSRDLLVVPDVANAELWKIGQFFDLNDGVIKRRL